MYIDNEDFEKWMAKLSTKLSTNVYNFREYKVKRRKKICYHTYSKEKKVVFAYVA